jgi:hypothetical protein
MGITVLLAVPDAVPMIEVVVIVGALMDVQSQGLRLVKFW